MTLLKLLVIVNVVAVNVLLSFADHHHVYHRIHVPTKVKTIYHTKFVKVPEHHHYIHEKEKPKLVKVPEHHHYFHEKEKEKLVDLSQLHQQQHHHQQPIKDEEVSFGHDFDFGQESAHTVYKKHAPVSLQYKKQRQYLHKRPKGV